MPRRDYGLESSFAPRILTNRFTAIQLTRTVRTYFTAIVLMKAEWPQ